MHIFYSHESKHWKIRERIGRVLRIRFVGEKLKAKLLQSKPQDVLEIITVFFARLYGARSRKNQKILEALKEAAATL